MTRSAATRALLAAATGIVGVAVATPPAGADPHPTHPGIVSASPANKTPDVLDGQVDAFAAVGDTMIVGGRFSQVDDGAQIWTRHNIFAFSISTGRVLPAFTANADGEVTDLQVAPDQQSVIAVGGFSAVNGQPKTQRVAELSVSNGGVLAGFASPRPNRVVRDIVSANDHYYIAGSFTTLDGDPRAYLAALNPDGTDAGTVDLDIAGTNNGGATNIRSMDVDAAGATLAIAGNFASIDGQPRGQVALLDVTSSSTSLNPWSTEVFAAPCGAGWDTYMRDVAFAPSGAFFVVATTGGPMGSQANGLLCDTVSRWDVVAEPGAQPAWVNYTGGDTLTAAIVDDNVVYVGGHQRWLNNSYGHNSRGRGGIARSGVAALDPVNGMPYDWNPGRTRGYGVSGFALTSAGLWVGSDTDRFGGELHGRIAFCPVVGGSVLPPFATGSLPGRLAILRSEGRIERIPFDGDTTGESTTLHTTERWGGVRGAFLVDHTLYTGWSDASMTQRAFDGSTLGPAVSVRLHDGFRDLPDAAAMFFDPTSRRLYYTLRGDDALYYRYFEPQSDLAGSWRFTATTAANVRWANVSQAFIAGDTLYYVNRLTGNLRRVGWNAGTGTTAGPATDVAGPKIDGVDYRSHGLVAID